MLSLSILGNSRSVIDDIRSIIGDSGVMLPHVSSFTIVIYNRHIFIAQASGSIP